MDIKKFTENIPGELVRISVPFEDWAFVPAPLPPAWQFSENLWPLLMEARSEIARLDGVGRTLPNPDLLLRPLQSREALLSSSLEGTYATPEQLLLFEMNPREPSSERDPANSWLEVSNYGRALREGIRLLTELPFCLRLIKELHKHLLTGVRGRDKAPGDFRTTQVYIGADKRFIPSPPERLTSCLDKFEKYMNQEDPRFDPLVRCYLLHYQFECIHPFLDGNGRVGRTLLSLMIFSKLNLSMPWLYMSAFFEKHKDEYIDHMFRVSTEAAWQKWIEFCLIGTVEQARDSIRRCDELIALRDQFHKNCSGLGNRAHPIIEELFMTPLVTVPEVASRHGITYPTAKSDIGELLKLGILKELTGTHPKTFFCPAIFNIAYGEN